MKWYAVDWRGDPALRMCSFAARGLWADMLSIIHDEGEPYGYLVIHGRAPTPAQLARMLGGTADEITTHIQELEEAGVFSRSPSGAIYSRRMVRDKAKADKAREDGKAGGNPSLKGGVNPGLNGGDKAQKPEARGQKPETRNLEILSEEGFSKSDFLPPLPALRASLNGGPSGATKEGKRELWRAKVTRYVTINANAEQVAEFATEVGKNSKRGRDLLNHWDALMRQSTQEHST